MTEPGIHKFPLPGGGGTLRVRSVMVDGEPHLVGKDVAGALGYADPLKAIKQHCRGAAKHRPIRDALGRVQEVRVLSEPDVLRLIINSKLPAAVEFERWVFETVLPSIRKHGGYVTGQETMTREQTLAAALKLADLEHRPPTVHDADTTETTMLPIRRYKFQVDGQVRPRDIRAVTLDGEPWWVAMDLREALGISDATGTSSLSDKVARRQKRTVQLSAPVGGHLQSVLVINAEGLRAVARRSRMPASPALRRWIEQTIPGEPRSAPSGATPSLPRTHEPSGVPR